MSRTNRSGEAVAAQHRKAGPMKHRNQPRGGARNEFLEYLDEYQDAIEHEYDFREVES